jgi:hypothetical protein
MVDGIAYQVIENTNTVKVVRALNPYEGSIFIPSTIAYNQSVYQVTGVDSTAFQNNVLVTSVVMPASIHSIANVTFKGCSALRNVVLPHSVVSIGKDAFRDCASLKAITIPASVKRIGSGAFVGCRSLKKTM